MKILITIPVSLVILILFSGCPNNNKTKYPNGVFPKQPVNFTEVNSEFDDYNSALPVINRDQYLFFSSNRKSAGDNFDVVGDNLSIWWDMEDGLLTVDNSVYYYDTKYLDSLFLRINTTGNEFGPYSLNYYTGEESDNILYYNLVTYSTNFESDSYSSKLVYYESKNSYTGSYHGPFEIPMINSMNNAQYISFQEEDISNYELWKAEPAKFTKMIFNADNNGHTDIYSVDLPESDNFIEMLLGEVVVNPEKISVLSSDSEDKCPFVNLNCMVFTSNRPGGFGGYDLYYSWFENGSWSNPTNFGVDINTEYDEFRPVTVIVDQFVNDLMIFSSNRPEGKGGFDLYYVGLPFKIYE